MSRRGPTHRDAFFADARFADPLDRALIRQLPRHHKGLVAVEHAAHGGFGAMVMHSVTGDWMGVVRSAP